VAEAHRRPHQRAPLARATDQIPAAARARAGLRRRGQACVQLGPIPRHDQLAKRFSGQFFGAESGEPLQEGVGVGDAPPRIDADDGQVHVGQERAPAALVGLDLPGVTRRQHGIGDQLVAQCQHDGQKAKLTI
jgi:hypothetical protein